MPAIPKLEEFLWYLGLAVMAAVLLRLYSIHLIRRYPALFCCLGFQLSSSVFMLTLKVNSNAYALTYFATLPVLLASYIWVALEIYSHAFENYRGLFVVGRGVMLGVLGVSATIAMVIHMGELNAANERFQIIRAALLIESAVCLTLLLFLVVIAAFLVWYPANVRKNLLLYSFSFSVYMAAQCVTIFMRNSDPTTMTRIASTVRLLMDNLSLLALAIFFQKAWESDRRPQVTGLSSGHKQRVLSHLSELNAALETRGKRTQSTH